MGALAENWVRLEAGNAPRQTDVQVVGEERPLQELEVRALEELETVEPGLTERLIPGVGWECLAACRDGDVYGAAVRTPVGGGHVRVLGCIHPRRAERDGDGARLERVKRRARERALLLTFADALGRCRAFAPFAIEVLPGMVGTGSVVVEGRAFGKALGDAVQGAVVRGLEGLCEAAEALKGEKGKWMAFEYFVRREGGRNGSSASDWFRLSAGECRYVLGSDLEGALSRSPVGECGAPFALPLELYRRLDALGIALGGLSADLVDRGMAWSVCAQWRAEDCEGRRR